MICRYFWWPGMRQSIYQHIKTCELCIQFLPNKIHTRPMHLEILQVAFAGCAVDTIGLLPTMSKGNRYVLNFMYLQTSYLIVVALKSKTAKDITMAYIKHILLTKSCSTFILQDNDTKVKNSQLVDTFKSLGIKPIHSNQYRPQGNASLENVHNFLNALSLNFSIVAHWSGITSY